MKDLSLHILDITENSIKSNATKITIKFIEEKEKLTLIIEDNGKGMDEETKTKALSPFFSTKKTSKYGLGLPLLKQACEATGGNLLIESEVGKGTKITAIFNKNHIDMKPLGDIRGTLIALQTTHPEIEIDFDYDHKDNS
ncbi:MAG: ATP-binding protein [Acidobacteria bacterium]|nr:ATP-binding protein [Acidobacteriota bacterium]